MQDVPNNFGPLTFPPVEIENRTSQQLIRIQKPPRSPEIMDTNVAATELIYLNVKPTVKPEDGDSDAGRLFLDSIKQLSLQPQCYSVVWGRSFEDPSFITVVTRKYNTSFTA